MDDVEQETVCKCIGGEYREMLEVGVQVTDWMELPDRRSTT